MSDMADSTLHDPLGQRDFGRDGVSESSFGQDPGAGGTGSRYSSGAGNTGLLAWREYQVEHRQLEAQAREVASRREVLERHTKLLDPRRVNPDFADQLARENLGVLGPDEVIIDLPPPPA